MKPILNSEQRRLLGLERDLLARLEAALPESAAGEAERATLAAARRQLDELFLLVVVGEFNSGKSALINTLLGTAVLAEGVTPTTAEVHVLAHGPVAATTHEGGLVHVRTPVDWLQDLRLVDTPGTNAVLRRHQEITEEFVPRADVVLFTTSADRPFTESERAFLEGVRDWGKKIVVVVNKIDILEGDDAVGEVVEFVRRQATALLGTEPELFPVSVRWARRAREAAAPEERDRLAAASRFAALETFILTTLDERERFRLKLVSPLGVAEKLLGAARGRAQETTELLRDDVETLDTIERQLTAYAHDLQRDFVVRLARVDNLLHDLRLRGDRFLEEMIRLGRLFDLLNGARLRAEFERQVVADVHSQLEAEVSALIDWTVERNYRQWQDVMKALNRQAAGHRDRVVGELGGDFEINRQQLLDSIGAAARKVAATYDKSHEARQLTESIQMGLAAVGAAEVGAIGLGAALLHALTRALDPLGILAAGGLAVLGLYILPARRRSAKKDLDSKIADLRQRLGVAMTTQFERETERAVQKIREAISPYARFVRTERERLATVERELTAIAAALADLRRQLGA